MLTKLQYSARAKISLVFIESTPYHELSTETENRCHPPVLFSRLSQTFNAREYIARIHLLDDARSEFFTGRIQINLGLCLLNFLILRDDLVCIIALKLSLILFMNSERFSKMPSDGMTVRLKEVFAALSDISVKDYLYCRETVDTHLTPELTLYTHCNIVIDYYSTAGFLAPRYFYLMTHAFFCQT